MYGISDKLFITGLFVLFVTVILGGVFSSQVAVIWFKNKKEERKNENKQRELDRMDRFEKERSAWYELAKEQNQRIEKMSEELTRLTRDYENAKKLMKKINLKGEENESDRI